MSDTETKHLFLLLPPFEKADGASKDRRLRELFLKNVIERSLMNGDGPEDEERFSHTGATDSHFSKTRNRGREPDERGVRRIVEDDLRGFPVNRGGERSPKAF